MTKIKLKNKITYSTLTVVIFCMFGNMNLNSATEIKFAPLITKLANVQRKKVIQSIDNILSINAEILRLILIKKNDIINKAKYKYFVRALLTPNFLSSSNFFMSYKDTLSNQLDDMFNQIKKNDTNKDVEKYIKLADMILIIKNKLKEILNQENFEEKNLIVIARYLKILAEEIEILKFQKINYRMMFEEKTEDRRILDEINADITFSIEFINSNKEILEPISSDFTDINIKENEHKEKIRSMNESYNVR